MGKIKRNCSPKWYLILFLVIITPAFCDQPIIFNALPKSASVYIGSTLCHGLKKTMTTISYDRNPLKIECERIESLVATLGLAREHLEASEENIELLSKFNLKLIFHVRDLRQQVISAAHHIHKDKTNPYWIQSFVSLGFDIRSWTFDDFLDHEIKYLPWRISFIQGWIDAYERKSLDIMITTFEDYYDNSEEFIRKILAFYDIPFDSFVAPNIPKDPFHHYRKGSKDEWRDVLNEEQINEINSLIPEDFFERFRWIR